MGVTRFQTGPLKDFNATGQKHSGNSPISDNLSKLIAEKEKIRVQKAKSDQEKLTPK
jgi:hypothetical protein